MATKKSKKNHVELNFDLKKNGHKKTVKQIVEAVQFHQAFGGEKSGINVTFKVEG